MRLLILGLNYAPEQVGIAVYTTGMAEALAAAGHEVRVIAGQPYYPSWRVPEGFRRWAPDVSIENGVRITRVPHYVPSVQSGWRRLLHQASFAASALLPAIWSGLAWRPDLVLAIAPSMTSAPVARLAAALAGAHSWLHIQDFEVDAAFATGLLDAHRGLGALARWFEAGVLHSFERISAISPEMCQRLAGKGVPKDRISEFRNWADTNVRPMSGPSPFREQWDIRTEHVALYSGNIGNKQGIGIVLDAARLLQHRRDLTFVICGEGSERQRLMARGVDLGNVRFCNLQPQGRLHDLMGLATVHLLPQAAGVADLMLPSKLTNMLASGRPVIATSAPGTGLTREVDGCGLTVPPGDALAFADAIERLVDDEALRATTSSAARRRAEERWAKTAILGSLDMDLARLTSRAAAPSAPVA